MPHWPTLPASTQYRHASHRPGPHHNPQQLKDGIHQGMQLLDMALLEAIEAKEIDPDDALRFSNDKRKFQRYATETDMFEVIDTGGNEKLIS